MDDLSRSNEAASNRGARGFAALFCKGLAMGAADVVPGVSGGTIAFITGIYDELIHSLGRCKLSLIPKVFTDGIASVWREINGWFLLVLFSGVLISIKTFAAVISRFLESHPILVWSFFSGLILASIPLLIRQWQKWQLTQWAAFLLGAIVVYGVSIASPAQLPGHWWILFLGGFVAICAMILPGVSGSFLLLLAGLYPVFIDAINTLQWVLLLSFFAGCVCGLMCFSKVLAWMLDRYHSTTLAVLTGFLLGSLNVTWPWKQTLVTMTNRHGELVPLTQKNILPTEYSTLINTEPMILTSLLCATGGLFLVLLSEFVSVYLSKSSN